MEIPVSDPGYGHQQQTWEGWNGWGGIMSPACSPTAFPTLSPPSGYHLQTNGAPQNGPAAMGPTAMPGSTVNLDCSQPVYWSPLQPHCNGACH